MKKGVNYETRTTKQLFQHLGGFGPTTGVDSQVEGEGPVFVLKDTNTRLITQRAKLIIAFLKSISSLRGLSKCKSSDKINMDLNLESFTVLRLV